MTKIKLRLLVILFALITASSGAVAVVRTEQEKKLNKYLAEKDYYTSLYNAWALYKSQYSQQIAQIKEDNKKNMASAKQNYEKLLLQQPALIAQHTKTVQEGANTQSGSQTVGNVTSTNNSASSTKTVTVTKPVSQPKTKTS